MELMNVTTATTMSSREIAELTGKEHKNVLADIRKMLVEISSAEKSVQYKDITGRSLPMLLLDKDESICLVSGYDAKTRMAIIRRWQELEEKERNPIASFSRLELLQIAMDSEQKRIAAEEARDHAIATKAQIGAKRFAFSLCVC